MSLKEGDQQIRENMDVKKLESMREEAGRKAFHYESTYHGCCQCTFLALQETLGLENQLAFGAASCLMGMFPVQGRTCGALTAGAMVMGMKYGRQRIEEGIAGVAKGMLQTERLVRRFREEFGTTVCGEISDGLTDAVLDEKSIRYMAEHPDEMEQASRDVIKKCAPVVKRTAEMVIEIIGEEKGG